MSTSDNSQHIGKLIGHPQKDLVMKRAVKCNAKILNTSKRKPTSDNAGHLIHLISEN